MTSLWHDTTVGAMQSVVIKLLDTMNNTNVRSQRKMRDSGVTWIGDVPEGWKVVRFVHEFSLSKGLNITKADLVPDGVAVVSYGQIHSRKQSW